jgi:hypothetical protein
MNHQHDPELWAEILRTLIGETRAANEGMRFGQLIFNALSHHDQATGRRAGLEYDEDFHSRLFNVYDEELIVALKEWHEWCEEQREK